MMNPRVFFDLTIDDHHAGRIVIELFADSNPIVAKKFWALCTGDKGITTVGKPLHYKGLTFHSVVPGFSTFLSNTSLSIVRWPIFARSSRMVLFAFVIRSLRHWKIDSNLSVLSGQLAQLDPTNPPKNESGLAFTVMVL
ncbi:hypothetical protein Ddye_018849 [Dipteronia dyeriana]|uniref:PPIase cyclophilin-type domain-containing protein n=1 Tax=Dipteronia dyeriana TaxID=168575 RepID=A0AAD9TXR9_9ROSI|nr:hypothetical protein Ddye_018849 [Dipteronia dyeriana]